MERQVLIEIVMDVLAKNNCAVSRFVVELLNERQLLEVIKENRK